MKRKSKKHKKILDEETVHTHDINVSANLSTANNSSNNSPNRPTYNSRGRGRGRNSYVAAEDILVNLEITLAIIIPTIVHQIAINWYAKSAKYQITLP